MTSLLGADFLIHKILLLPGLRSKTQRLKYMHCLCAFLFIFKKMIIIGGSAARVCVCYQPTIGNVGFGAHSSH